MGGKGAMMVRHHGGMMMGAGIGMLLQHKDALKLTADQVSKLQKMRSDAMKDGIKRQADLRTVMVDVADSLTKQPPDFNAAKQNMKKASDMKAAAKMAMIDNFEKAYNVLTKEQKDMLPTMMQSCCAMGMDEGDEEE
jgi:Spy/CpxP family protein refolding chaperone